MNIREFLLEKPQENNIISFLQDGASQSENQNTSEYLSNLKNEAINDFYKNKDKYAKEYEKYNIKDQNLDILANTKEICMIIIKILL